MKKSCWLITFLLLIVMVGKSVEHSLEQMTAELISVQGADQSETNENPEDTKEIEKSEFSNSSLFLIKLNLISFVNSELPKVGKQEKLLSNFIKIISPPPQSF